MRDVRFPRRRHNAFFCGFPTFLRKAFFGSTCFPSSIASLHWWPHTLSLPYVVCIVCASLFRVYGTFAFPHFIPSRMTYGDAYAPPLYHMAAALNTPFSPPFSCSPDVLCRVQNAKRTHKKDKKHPSSARMSKTRGASSSPMLCDCYVVFLTIHHGA